MKKLMLIVCMMLTAVASSMAADYALTSPDGKLKATVDVGKTITYTVSYDGQPLLAPSQIAVSVKDGKATETWGSNARPKQAKTFSHQGTIMAQDYKKAAVSDNYNALTLRFKDFTLLFRAYDEGVAYRFVSGSKKLLEITGEAAELNFAKDFDALVPYVKAEGDFKAQLHNSFENTYTKGKLSEVKATQLIFMPFIVKADNGVKVVVSESDVENYPCMYVRKGDKANSLKAFFSPYPKTITQGGHNNLEQIVETYEDYLVKAAPAQALPWRIVSVSANDKDLLDNDMVYRLASPSRLKDASWVKPGKVAWDWWNNWGLYHVPFKAGINTETYKYYIDFAARHNIEYVILDEGWAVNKQADLFQVVPEIDLKGIVDYAKDKGVGIILWAGYKAFDRDMEHVCKHYAEMGVKGFKIDFMNRNDADLVNFLYRSAATTARYHMVCDFHGIFAPTGLNRTYPNVVNFEGVAGQEQTKWSKLKDYDQVDYDVTIPFARNLAGPMDYTQGAMINSTRKTYYPSNARPMSQGTRSHQLAEYVIFLSPLNMLCDSPTHYEQEPECTDFIASIPTVWDETIPLTSEVGEYVAVARKKGGKWYVGAITNWTSRDLVLDLSPLNAGGKTATMFADGLNAAKFAEDYTKSTITIPADGKLKVHLAPGGGVAIAL